MIHVRRPRPTSLREGAFTPLPARAAPMPVALRALALHLGGPFAGLSDGTRRRLAVACNGFAELTGSAEGLDEESRSWPRFLLSALYSLQATGEARPITHEDEIWMVAEVEADFGAAMAMTEARAGRSGSPAPPRPSLLGRDLAAP